MYYNKGLNCTNSPKAQKRLEPGPRQDLRSGPALTVSARDHRARKAFHLAPRFGQKEARNEQWELGLCSRYGLNAGPDQRGLRETIRNCLIPYSLHAQLKPN